MNGTPPGISHHSRRDFNLFLAANVFLGIAACVEASTFNNYLRETFNLNVAQRTFLEFPRETPGFLVMLFFGALAALGDVRIAAIANITAGIGMMALGFIPPVYGIMLLAVFVMSTGQHLYFPLANAIGMSFAKDGREGKVLGTIAGANTVALVSSSLALMALFRFFSLSFAAAYLIGAVSLVSAGVLILMIRPVRDTRVKRRFVIRREYSLFYLFSVLFGARKQLFITFGPWMIVDFFAQPVTTMTFLFLVISIAGIAIKPAVGTMIDRIGERAILGAEALIIVGTCLIYLLAPGFLPPGAGLVAVCVAYVIDQSTNAVGMARSTYVKKIALKPEDVSPTLSLGISIDHVVSMFIPMAGGFVWKSDANGYKAVFLAGAIISSLNFLATRFMKKQPAITQ